MWESRGASTMPLQKKLGGKTSRREIRGKYPPAQPLGESEKRLPRSAIPATRKKLARVEKETERVAKWDSISGKWQIGDLQKGFQGQRLRKKGDCENKAISVEGKKQRVWYGWRKNLARSIRPALQGIGPK